MSAKAVPVTVLVQTKNEEAAIGACLDSLTEFAQVIVVDSNSEDRTVEIARSHGAEVVNFTWDGRYPKKKQWQLDNIATAHPWILFIDADERPTARLVEAIRTFVADGGQSGHAAAAIRLEYHFAGTSLRHGHRVSKTVLLRRDRARFEPADDLDIPGMGELEGHYQPVCDGKVARLSGLLEHDDPDPVRTWFDRHNRYSDWEAGLIMKSWSGASDQLHRSVQGRAFARVPFKPLAFFVYSYIFRLGFLDGRAGFDYAFALSSYYWQIGLKVREYRRTRTVS